MLNVMAAHGVEAGRLFAQKIGLRPSGPELLDGERQKLLEGVLEGMRKNTASTAAPAKRAREEAKDAKASKPPRPGAGQRDRTGAPPYQRPAYQQPAYQQPVYPAPAYQQAYQPGYAAAPAYSYAPPPPPYAQQVQPARSAQSSEPCYNCGQVGHWKSSCPHTKLFGYRAHDGLRPPQP